MMPQRPRFLSRSAAIALVAVAGFLAPLPFAAPAWAQTQPVKVIDPYFVVPTSNGVPLKSGPGLVYYAVAMLKSGQPLRVDGRTDDHWLRVEYPRGSKGFVKATDAAVEDGGKAVRLTKASTIWAVNISGGERANWRYLLEDEQPVGARFPVIESLKTPDGKVYGYLVPAPAEARAFVKEDSVRAATAEEATAAAATLGPATPPAAPVTTPVVTPEKPIAATPTPAANPETTTAPATPVAVNPVPAPATPAIATEPLEVKPAERRIGTVEQLQSVYQQAQSGKNAELPSVIAEFERAIAALESQGGDRRTIEFLNARLEVLRLRQQVQESLASSTAKSRTVLDEEARLGLVVAELQKNRQYVMVGRLVPSTVYDGKRLPKMYRVQSLESGFARTIGYLSPSGPIDLDGKLGRVIGVQGEARFDDALRLSIVTPREIDILTAVDIPGTATAAQPVDPGVDTQPVATGEPDRE
ncbi:MAG: hypothetical protein KF745_06025 [Phycisphaeraceae bacterium]|nr:hypothetical protein [Phycisphaeraceae bacterium]